MVAALAVPAFVRYRVCTRTQSHESADMRGCQFLSGCRG